MQCVFFFTVLEDAVKQANAEEICIPFGVGIAGTVAETKETINITDAYSDERFNKEIDKKTGYKTNVMLSMPICNYEGDVIGVAQIINKTNGKHFELFFKCFIIYHNPITLRRFRYL